MIKKSVKQWITQCFVFIILFSAVTLSIWDIYANYMVNLSSREHRTQGCAKVVKSLLDHLDFTTLNDKETPEYRRIRSTLHKLCYSFAIDYIYVYRILPESNYREFIFSTSRSDEMDEILKKERSLGAIATEPLTPGEIRLDNGDLTIQRTRSDNKYGQEVIWLVPYCSKDGKLLAIIGIDFNLQNGHIKIFRDFLSDIFPMLIPLILGMVIVLYLVNNRISIPLTRISENMIRFAHDARNKPEKIITGRNDEIGEIADAFDKMAGDISNYINNIERLTRERVETNVQLEIARRIQHGLVPEKTELNSKNFTVSAVTKPAKKVGGDFYDCFQKDDDTLCIMIGDISGKGISAAIFMSMTKTMIREKLMTGLSPAETLNYVNDEICKQNPENIFATTFIAVLHAKTGELCYANAGHTWPLLLNDNPDFMETDNGIAIGLFEDAGIKDYSLHLSKNQGIMLYTDGITDANKAGKTFFGTEGLLKAVKSVACGADNGKAQVEAVLKSIRDFSAGTEQFDDTAILAAYLK